MDARQLAQISASSNPKCPPVDLAITTPNHTFIPTPTIGLVDVRGRSDGNFGPDDFTIWPQWFHTSLSHLPFVIKKPSPYSGSNILWLWNEVSLENKSAVQSSGLKNSSALDCMLSLLRCVPTGP